MSDSRWPYAVYVLLLVFGVLYAMQVYPQLPERMASHFAADGRPNGWSPKEFFFILMAVVTALTAIPTFLVPLKLRNMPRSRVNLPNKDYWLSPEHEEETYQFFRAYMAWFGCALLFVLLYGSSQAVKANLSGTYQFDSDNMLYVLIGFALFVGVWLLLLFRHFSNIPPESRPLR